MHTVWHSGGVYSEPESEADVEYIQETDVPIADNATTSNMTDYSYESDEYVQSPMDFAFIASYMIIHSLPYVQVRNFRTSMIT